MSTPGHYQEIVLIGDVIERWHAVGGITKIIALVNTGAVR